VENLDLGFHAPPTWTFTLGGLGCHLCSPKRHLSVGVVILKAFMRLLAHVGKILGLWKPSYHVIYTFPKPEGK
jgi:hypothetical protein